MPHHESDPEERAQARVQGFVTAVAPQYPSTESSFQEHRAHVAQTLQPVTRVLFDAFLLQAAGKEPNALVETETTADGLRRAAGLGFLRQAGKDAEGHAKYLPA